MVSVCTVPARGGRSCEHFGGYKTINRIPLILKSSSRNVVWFDNTLDKNFSIENDFTKYLKESCW